MLKTLKQWYEKSERFFHPLVGVASYDKYLEHMRKKHPQAPCKSRKDFFKDFIEKKYNNLGKC